MRQALFCPLLLLLLTPLCGAGEDQDKAPSPAEQYKRLVKEFETAQQETTKAFDTAKTETEQRKALTDFRKLQITSAARFLDLAQKHPRDDAAVDALVWVVLNSQFAPEADRAADTLIKDHLQHAKVGHLTREAADAPSPAGEKVARAYLEKSTRRDVQAEALLNLARQLKNKAENVQLIKQKNSILAEGVELLYGKEVLKQLQALDAGPINKEAEELLDRLIEKYADVKSPFRNPADEAKRLLFEVRYLALGKTAPEIEGEDIDGKKFKLSDYRGRVVLLVFWGNW